jgi:hypothetical protein
MPKNSNKLTSSSGALLTIIKLQAKTLINSMDLSRQTKLLMPWCKSKNSHNIIWANSHKITWVLPSMDTSSMKPEICQAKEMNKSKRHLILDRLSFISELMSKLTNHLLTNIVLQLLKMVEIRNLLIW